MEGEELGDPLLVPDEVIPKIEFDMGATSEAGAKLFQPIPTNNIKIAIFVTATFLLIFGGIVLALAAVTQDRLERDNNIIMSVVMIAAGFMSIYASYARDRGGLQLVWLLNVWQMANGTKLIYKAVGNISRLGNICDTKDTDEEKDTCRKQSKIVTGSAVVLIIAWFFALSNAWLSANLSEKIQDDDDLIERKRDIRFALAKQALSMRAQQHWKRSFLKVRAIIRWKKAQGIIESKSKDKSGYKFGKYARK
eukprot:comp17475_c0_seq1/m.29601 comp17475_c0_seq1/g.29601  ORF comp17475_c0_seq1/g.29601 comp17475_c0_seq1/m.29601 type:complete len:251 (+) comp17475_c0_seq1:5-757(+)